MALTITPARFYSALNVPSTTITDLLRVTEALCRRFLSLEPDAVLADTIDEDVFLEAMIRVAAYLISVEGAALASTDIGDAEIRYRGVGNVMRVSGAAGLLAPWVTHRAGIVGESDDE